MKRFQLHVSVRNLEESIRFYSTLFAERPAVPADRFFAGLGFRRLPRELAPSEIKSTTQFSALCPATAVLMGKP